ncbi:hypothetical protein MYO4S_00099 [Serratia phage 4S]|nr:hypothetical protein MYO4S_00099 [Serratia phage 4S]
MSKTLQLKQSKVGDFINTNTFNGEIFDLIGLTPFIVNKHPLIEDEWTIDGKNSDSGYFLTDKEIRNFFIDLNEQVQEQEQEAPAHGIKAVYNVKLGDGILRKAEEVQLNMVVNKDNVDDLIDFLTREFK